MGEWVVGVVMVAIPLGLFWWEARWQRRVRRASGDPVALARLLGVKDRK